MLSHLSARLVDLHVRCPLAAIAIIFGCLSVAPSAMGQTKPPLDWSLHLANPGATTAVQDDASPPLPGTTPPPGAVEEEPLPTYRYAFEVQDHSGYYFRGGGMIVDLDEDARLIDGSGSVDTDESAGFALAIGYRYPHLPISLEFEYAYRSLETDDFIDPVSGFLGDTEVGLHTFMFNVMYDRPDLFGPVGIYAGGGVGFQVQAYHFSNSSMGGSDTEVDGDGFYYQLMAGVTVSLNRNLQFYSGVRWGDGKDIEEDGLRLDPENTSIEFGLRWFF